MRANVWQENPLDRLNQGGWRKGLLRLGIGLSLLALVMSWTGQGALELVWKGENLGALGLGALLVGAQRVLRVRKWAWVVHGTSLRPRPWLTLLRIQFLGLLANLLLPVSEALKIWAVSRERSDVPRAIGTLVIDNAWLTLAVACVGALGVSFQAEGWLWAAPGGLGLLAVGLLLGLRFRPGGDPIPAMGRSVLASLAEAALLCGAYAVAMQAMGIEMDNLRLLAVFPLLYLSHLVMLTPSGLGMREALFALVFAHSSETPAETAVAVGLMVSAMQLTVTLCGGSLALLLPSADASADEEVSS